MHDDRSRHRLERRAAATQPYSSRHQHAGGNGVDCGAGQEIGQPRRGFALAQRLCSECHAIQKEYARSPNVNAPRFQAIASSPGMTAIALSAALNTSHHSMPNIMLAVGEQADIIAYSEPELTASGASDRISGKQEPEFSCA